MPVKPPIGSASSRIMVISTPVPPCEWDSVSDATPLPRTPLRSRRTVSSATQPR